MKKSIPCTVLILTLNSEKTLDRALKSVQEFDNILVLDGNSVDRTVQIAKQYGAQVIPQYDTNQKQVAIVNFSEVRNKGIGLAQYPWILCLDSDEYLSTESVNEIRGIVENRDSTPCVYRLPRKYVYEGLIIERASTYPSYQNRFFHKQAVFGYVKAVHENLKRKPGVPLKDLIFPEYVPLDPPAVVREKMKKYLSLQQTALKDLTFNRLIKGLRSNAKKFFTYILKYFLTFVRGKGKRMPFWYEFSNATYHARLFFRLIQNYFRKIFL